MKIDSYQTDNGIFKSQRYVEAIKQEEQTIRYSGVGAKWQNGVAEGAIRIVVSKARTCITEGIHRPLKGPAK